MSEFNGVPDLDSLLGDLGRKREVSEEIPLESMGGLTGEERELFESEKHHADREMVVDDKGENSRVRQAGCDADDRESVFTGKFKEICEKSLYAMGVGVMGRNYLTKELHKPLCDRLQKVPPFRKMILFPRDHAKTSVVSHCLPIHILIQPAEGGIYFPGLKGTECRILLCGETETRAKSNLSVLRMAFDGNLLLRTLWPDCVWEKSSSQSSKWNDSELVLPRETHFPDSNIKAIGVGGAVAGARPNVLIKDDMVSLRAAMSQVEMQNSIDWHNASRALLDEYEKDSGLESLEFILGTRWAVFDVYQYIIDNDPTVDVQVRSIVEDGKFIWPERFNEERLVQLKRDNPMGLFYLLYMNSPADKSLTDFDVELIRGYKLSRDGMAIEFDEAESDFVLRERVDKGEVSVGQNVRLGKTLDRVGWGELLESVGGGKNGRGEYMRLKYG